MADKNSNPSVLLKKFVDEDFRAFKKWMNSLARIEKIKSPRIRLEKLNALSKQNREMQKRCDKQERMISAMFIKRTKEFEGNANPSEMTKQIDRLIKKTDKVIKKLSK